jgi:hypothetical protein
VKRLGIFFLLLLLLLLLLLCVVNLLDGVERHRHDVDERRKARRPWPRVKSAPPRSIAPS